MRLVHKLVKEDIVELYIYSLYAAVVLQANLQPSSSLNIWCKPSVHYLTHMDNARCNAVGQCTVQRGGTRLGVTKPTNYYKAIWTRMCNQHDLFQVCLFVSR